RGLRTPLESARRHLEALSQGRNGELTDDQKAPVQAAQERLAEINQLIGQAARPTAPLPTRTLAAVNLNDLSRQALARFTGLAQQNGLRVTSELAAPPVLAWADAAQVGLVLDGLLSNAIRFSYPGGKVMLRVDLDPNQQPHVSVRDQGMGVAPEDQPRIFEPDGCRQAPVAQTPGGPAAGLRTMRDLVTASGGRMWVESQPDKGAAFHFTLLPPQE
ncbi:MAG TPA: ATP-binding protein, partial [Anaerolineaceae bacterium]